VKRGTTKSDNEELLARLRPIIALERQLQKQASPASILEAARTALPSLSSETVAAVERLISEVAGSIKRRLSEFESDLRDLAQANGWRLEGTWPTFQIERGVEVRIDEANSTVRVAGSTVDATDLDAITNAVRTAVRDLVPKGFSPSTMLEQLRESHAALRPEGGQVPILDLYARFVMDNQSKRFWRDARTDRFSGISADQFRARLSKMLEDGATVAQDGSELRLLPPLDPKDALFMYLPIEARFGYVGRVEFVGGRR
jgi:hypothetical protein